MALKPKDDDGGGTIIIIINRIKAAAKKAMADYPNATIFVAGVLTACIVGLFL